LLWRSLGQPPCTRAARNSLTRAARQAAAYGVEVLEGERIGPKARADEQVDARNHLVGRDVLARDVLDQARAPAHGSHASPTERGEGRGRAQPPWPSRGWCHTVVVVIIDS
jgi:hypothetical protein